MMTPRPRRSDVHAGTALDRLEPLEDLDRTCIVRAAGMLGSGFSPQRGPSSSHVPRKKQYRSYQQRFAPEDCNTTLPFSQRASTPFCAYLSLFGGRRGPLRHTTACSIRDATTRYAHHAGPPQDLGVEVVEVGGGYDGLRALQEIPGEKVPPALVELAHHVVEEQDRVLTRLGPDVVPGRELERERRQPLLPLRPERREVDAAEQDLEVVPVRPDGRGAALDVGAVRLFERLRVAVEGRAIGVADRGPLRAVQGPQRAFEVVLEGPDRGPAALQHLLPELDHLPVPSPQRPLGGEPVPDPPQELVALLHGLGVLGDRSGVGRTQRGEQAIQELPAVGRGALGDPDVVREERNGPPPGPACRVVGERRRRCPVNGQALLLSRGVADGHLALLRGVVEGDAGLDAGEVPLPAHHLGVVGGAGRGAGDGEGDRLEQVRLALGVVADHDVQARAEQDGVVGVVAEVYEAQGAQVGGQPTSRRSSPTSTTSPGASFRPRRVSTSPLTSTSPAWIRTFASPPLPTRSEAFNACPSVMAGSSSN